MPLTEHKKQLLKKNRRKRYLRYRDEYTERLGGKCAVCGSTERLVFVHKDLSQRKFGITSGINQRSTKATEEELQKCILLCAPDSWKRITKYRQEQAVKAGKILSRDRHGTLVAYNDCGPPKCEACRMTKKAYMVAWRQRKKIKEGKLRLLTAGPTAGA